MSKRNIAITFSVAVLAVIIGVGVGVYNYTSSTSAEWGTDSGMIVGLRGSDVAVSKILDDFGDGKGTLEALCFDMDMVNVATGQVIGTAEDCLAEVADGTNGGMLLTGTTFFNFPEGQLVSRGRTTVHPLNEMAPGAVSTHITGAIPAPGSNQVLQGTGRFDGAAGTVRLSGAVDLSGFSGEGTPITFDCLFEINLRGG
jgi:hypothetical protein